MTSPMPSPWTSPWSGLTPAVSPRLPARVRDWIGLETSMTARIGQVVGGPIAVEVLRQAQGRLYPDETGFFAPGVARPVVREVCLSARGRPYLVARTALTSQKLQRHPTIVELGNKALGSLLFAGPKPCRYSARDYGLLRHGHPLFALAGSRDSGVRQAYWARRTLFWLFDEPLLVTEIFLPSLLTHKAARRD